MTKRHLRAGVSALSRTWAAMHLHWRALTAARSLRRHQRSTVEAHFAELLRVHRPLIRRLTYGGAALATFCLLASVLLWWRLTSGPLSLEVATPWLTSDTE